jgi:hypothetical protein
MGNVRVKIATPQNKMTKAPLHKHILDLTTCLLQGHRYLLYKHTRGFTRET